MTRWTVIHRHQAGRDRVRAPVGGLPRLLHRLVELFGIKAGIIERVAATPVRQGEFGRDPDVFFSDRVGAAPRSVRDRRPGDHQIGTHSVDIECCAECGDSP